MNLQIEGQHLAVEFADAESGPRLVSVEHHESGATFRFRHANEVGLVAMVPEATDDPSLVPEYAFQDTVLFQGASASENGCETVLRFESTQLKIDVVYELQVDLPILRKRVVCTAKEGAVYVAGVMLWRLEPESASLIWPQEDTQGQPAVLLGDAGGCFVTLEWPSARVKLAEGGVRLEFRPGYLLAPGETREVASGSIGCFSLEDSPPEPIEVARRAFFRHVRDRVQPICPMPIKFTTWGPWLAHLTEDRIREIAGDLEYVGTDLLHLDAGWQPPHFPYSRTLPAVRGAEDAVWNAAFSHADRFPGGLLAIRDLAERHGMQLSLWFDAVGAVFVREDDTWAMRHADGNPVFRKCWETPGEHRPVQSLASEYGRRLREFVLGMFERYGLGGVMFDDNSYGLDFAGGRESMASAWNARDVQLRQILEIFDEVERRKPGVYRFFCRRTPWPWALKHATHIHAGDPSTSRNQAKAGTTDYPLRALAYERRLAWRDLYEQFVPPWGIKGDIAGWSLQQKCPIPINLDHTERIPGVGEGWTQNLFTCLATTAVRDIRFCFGQMPAFDRGILKEWITWDRRRAEYPFHARPVSPPNEEPDEGVDVISQIENGRGVLYAFNRSFDRSEARIVLNEAAGFRKEDTHRPAHLVYPIRTSLPKPLVYGDTLSLPLIGKDCAVIEVGLEAEKPLEAYPEYTQATERVVRSFEPVYLTDSETVTAAVQGGDVRLEAGSTAVDRALAAILVDALSVSAGKRCTVSDWTSTREEAAACRLIVGTFEGLSSHPEIRDRFQETLCNRYVEWDGQLYSAPLAAELAGADRPTYCLLGPRPEHLSRLGIDLAKHLLTNRETVAAPPGDEELSTEVCFSAKIPEGRPVLRFRPVVDVLRCDRILPADLPMLRFEITATSGNGIDAIWREEIPPFVGPPWWQDRVVSLADLAGKEVELRLSARPVSGRPHPLLIAGFSRVAVFG